MKKDILLYFDTSILVTAFHHGISFDLLSKIILSKFDINKELFQMCEI